MPPYGRIRSVRRRLFERRRHACKADVYMAARHCRGSEAEGTLAEPRRMQGLVLAMGCYYRLHCLCGSLLCASLRQVADGW